jgi:hypothetical protein
MKNKQIGWYGVISLVVFLIATIVGGDYEGGTVSLVWYASLVGFYTFIIWGWVRLIKSND